MLCPHSGTSTREVFPIGISAKPDIAPHFEHRERCPACGSEKLSTVFSRSYGEPHLRRTLERFYGERLRSDYALLLHAEFELQKCETCDLILQRHVPDAYLLRKLYNEWIDPRTAYAQFIAAPDLRRRLRIARTTFVGLSLVRSSGRRLRTLDVGCGWGDWPLMTRALGADAWGTELSIACREGCLSSGIRIVDDEQLPDRFFDFINLEQVFEHLPHPRATLEFLRGKLAPDGILRIAVPNGTRVLGKLHHFDLELERPQGGGLYAVAPLQHLNCFSYASLSRLASSCTLRRVVPPWRLLIAALHFSGGMKQCVKEMLRPLYLRSNATTELYFRSS